MGLHELSVSNGGAVHDHAVCPASVRSGYRLRLGVGGEEAARVLAAFGVPRALVESELRAVVEQPPAERLLDGGDGHGRGHRGCVVHLPYDCRHWTALRLYLGLYPPHVRHEPHTEQGWSQGTALLGTLLRLELGPRGAGSAGAGLGATQAGAARGARAGAGAGTATRLCWLCASDAGRERGPWAEEGAYEGQQTSEPGRGLSEPPGEEGALELVEGVPEVNLPAGEVWSALQ